MSGLGLGLGLGLGSGSLRLQVWCVSREFNLGFHIGSRAKIWCAILEGELGSLHRGRCVWIRKGSGWKRGRVGLNGKRPSLEQTATHRKDVGMGSRWEVHALATQDG